MLTGADHPQSDIQFDDRAGGSTPLVPDGETMVKEAAEVSFLSRLRAHVAIARIDHWTKNVFIIPGLLVPISIEHPTVTWGLVVRLVIGLAAASLIASSNYVINEVLDAPFDRLHPIKKYRPVASGLVNIPLAYIEWISLVLIGLTLAAMLSRSFLLVLSALWIMGCIYNIPPIRSKDVPYVDVLSEAVNNPLRMLAGWYIVTDVLVPPVSLLAAYWMVGCYFMALKRFSEYRELENAQTAIAYRKSFRSYDERSLLVSITFYAATGMLFFGAFIIRYRLELVLSFPLVALVMALYFNLAFDKNSPVQNPEHLYKNKPLMLAVTTCAAIMIILLFVDVPVMAQVFRPTLPLGLK